MLLIVFRVDASVAIGSGHVVRCLTLASVLREQRADVVFVCRAQEGDLCALIESRGFAIRRLSATNAVAMNDVSPPHSAWLRTSWQEDANQTWEAIESLGVKPDWLIVDHYGIDARWESVLRPATIRCMAIDDLADRTHDCDLLLDQNIAVDMFTRYASKLRALCVQLIGPEFALLQPMYAQLHDRVIPREGPVRRIFVYFGGVDSHNLTGRTLSACALLDRMDIEIDVVISSASPFSQVVCDQVAEISSVRVHKNLATLAPLMAQADIAIGATGVTAWERLCVGLPALVITIADNQRPVTRCLHDQGLVYWIGHHDQVDENAIAEALERIIGTSSLQDWSQRCLNMCDGQGVARVVKRIMAFSHESLV